MAMIDAMIGAGFARERSNDSPARSSKQARALRPPPKEKESQTWRK
jgi:hypothetical protein